MLVTGNDKKISYKIKCVKYKGIEQSQTVQKSTTLQTFSGTTDCNDCINYLDRHNVSCDNGYGISQFQIQRGSGNDSPDIKYNYTCMKVNYTTCKSYQTTQSPFDGGKTYALKNQYVGELGCETNVLKSFRLDGNSKDDGYLQYTYEKCTLKDLELDRLKTASIDLTQQVANLTTEKTTLTAEKNSLTTERNNLLTDKNNLTTEKTTLQNQFQQCNSNLDNIQNAGPIHHSPGAAKKKMIRNNNNNDKDRKNRNIT